MSKPPGGMAFPSGGLFWSPYQFISLLQFPAKPAPDALLNLMARRSLEPAQCLMLGDRSIDVEAARNAGIAGCLFDPEHFYDDFKNDLRTHCVEGLRPILGL